MEVATNFIAVIILQHVNVLNQHIIYLKLQQCYISILYQYDWEKRNQQQFLPHPHPHPSPDKIKLRHTQIMQHPYMGEAGFKTR